MASSLSNSIGYKYSPPTRPYQRPTSMYTNTADGQAPPLPRDRDRRIRHPSLNEISHHTLNISQSAVPLSFVMESADTKNPPYPLSGRIIPDGDQSGGSMSSPYCQGNILIHFEMKLKVIEVLFERGGAYKVPLCSGNKFSILHNPNHNMAQAMMGDYYETVGHILAQHQKPKVVCVTRTYKGSSASGSVQDGDILIIQKVNKRSIRCLNVLTNQKKELADRCAGAFTTQPEKIKMALKDICKNVTLPATVVMYYQIPNSPSMKQTVVKLMKEVWEDSVIATHSDVEESIYRNIQLLRIVRDVGLNFVQEDMDEAAYAECSIKTVTIHRDFNYSMILYHLFSEDPVWPGFGEIQSSLYSNVDLTGDSIDRFIELKKPTKAFKTVKGSRRNTIYGSNGRLNQIGQDGNASYEYHTLRPVTNEELSNSGAVIDPNTVVVVDDKTLPDQEDELAMEDIATILHTVNTVNRQMMITVESLRAEVEGLKMELKQTKKMMNNMKKDFTTKLDELTYLCGETSYVTMEPGTDEDSSSTSTLSAAGNVERPPTTAKTTTTKTDKPPVATKPKSVKPSSAQVKDQAQESDPQFNSAILKELKHNEVLQVLEKLQLSKYIPMFKERQISGADLAKYDENMLRTQLGVQSQTDITCFMEVIQGSPSKWKILES